MFVERSLFYLVALHTAVGSQLGFLGAGAGGRVLHVRRLALPFPPAFRRRCVLLLCGGRLVSVFPLFSFLLVLPFLVCLVLNSHCAVHYLQRIVVSTM